MTTQWHTGTRPTRRMARLGAIACAVALAVGAPPPAQAAPRPAVIDRAHTLFMVSDSVGLGAVTAITTQFAGWKVTVTGKPGLFTEQLAGYVASAPLSAFGDSAIVATGYNYPYWDPPRFDRSIDYMMAALRAKGVQHVYWVNMREVKPAFYSGWNSLSSAYKTLYNSYPIANGQLRNALLRYPDLSIVDWADIADRTGITYDAIHLNPTGAAAYADLAYRVVSTGASRKPAGTVTVVPVWGSAGIPADAPAVAVNLTVTNPRTWGHLTAYPCTSPRPNVSQLNYVPGQTISNGAVVPVGTDGTICVFQAADSHVAVDLLGAFTADSGYVPALQRVMNTRVTGIPAANTVTRVHLAATAGAPPPPFTAAINVTTLSWNNGHLHVFSCDTAMSPIPTRALNAGRTEAVLQMVTTDANGDICILNTGIAHLVVDAFGIFPAGSDVHGITLRRVLDTRPSGAALLPGVPRATSVAPFAAPATTGLMLAVLADNPANVGTVSAWPCTGVRPTTGLLNLLPGRRSGNTALIAPDANGQVCLQSTVVTHLVVDISGWTGAGFVALDPARLLDTRS